MEIMTEKMLFELDIDEVENFKNTNHITENISPEIAARYPRCNTFNTLKELLQIDWINEYTEREDFIAFYSGVTVDCDMRRRIELLVKLKADVPFNSEILRTSLREENIAARDKAKDKPSMPYYVIGYLYNLVEGLPLIAGVPEIDKKEYETKILMNDQAKAINEIHLELTKIGAKLKR